MDPCRHQPPQQQRAVVSVNPFLYPPPAPVFHHPLTASVVHETYPHQQHFEQYAPRQPRYLPHHQYHCPQPHHRSQRYPGQQATIMNPALNNEHQHFAPGLSAEDAKAMFAGNFDDDSFCMLYASSMPANHQNPAYEVVPFRPLATPPPYEQQTITAPCKIEGRAPNDLMPLRNTHVDPREYSPVPVNEVWQTPIEADSPSTIDTDGGSVMTPAPDSHGFPDNYAWRYGSAESYPFGTASLPPHGNTFGQTTFGSFTSDGSPSSYVGTFSCAPSLTRGLTGSEQHHGLAIDLVPPHAAASAHVPENPSFDHPASDFDNTLSEADSSDDAASAASSQSSLEPAVRNDRDKMLLAMRADGLSYKEIKRQGKFKEAESTLRGRMRMLTKQKHERVRKPMWEPRDVDLLRHAVKVCHGKTRSKGMAKMPWLKISNWLVENGSSYAFAPATCAKKWSEVARR